MIPLFSGSEHLIPLDSLGGIAIHRFDLSSLRDSWKTKRPRTRDVELKLRRMRQDELEPLLTRDMLEGAAKDALRALYDSLDGDVLDLSDV